MQGRGQRRDGARPKLQLHDLILLIPGSEEQNKQNNKGPGYRSTRVLGRASPENNALLKGKKLNKYLAFVICGFLLAGPVSAQLTAEQQADIQKIMAISKRAGALLREAESQAM